MGLYDGMRDKLSESIPPDDHWPHDVVKEAIDKAKNNDRSSTRFNQVLDELLEMHGSKQSDYGRTGDPYANVRGSEDFGIEPWIGALVRATDKVRRLQKAARQTIEHGEPSLANEGVRDSLVDLAVYAVIATVLWDEGRPKYALPPCAPCEVGDEPCMAHGGPPPFDPRDHPHMQWKPPERTDGVTP